jgi:hypothetical protein
MERIGYSTGHLAVLQLQTTGTVLTTYRVLSTGNIWILISISKAGNEKCWYCSSQCCGSEAVKRQFFA